MAFEGEVNNEIYKHPFPHNHHHSNSNSMEHLHQHSQQQYQQAQHHDWADYWTMDRVLRWLDVNDFKPAVDVFKAKHICGKTFLDIDMSYLMAFQNDLALTYTDKRKLAHAIKSLRTSEDHYQSRLPTSNSNTRFNNSGIRYAIPTTSENRLPTSDSVIPLIPERKSSNNEQVLDWMKTFNIPKRTIPSPGTLVTSSNNNSINSRSNSSNIRSNSNNVNSTSQQSRYPMSPSSPRVGVENDGTWKFVRRRPPPPTQASQTTPSATLNSTTTTTTSSTSQDHPIQLPTPPQQTSIHVTKDSDTFHSLNVTGMHDPRLIKNAILRKLGLEGGCERYLFFHENGKHSETALTDGELSHLCQISDHSSTNRILARYAEHVLDSYRSYSKDGTMCYDFAPRGVGYQRSNPQQQRYLYAEPRPLINTYNNSDYEMNRSRYDLSSSNSGMISPINGNSQFTINSPENTGHGGMEDSRDDSGYFDKSGRNSRRQSKDVNAAELTWSTSHPSSLPPPSSTAAAAVETSRNAPVSAPSLWAVTPQSQRSSTSSSSATNDQQHLHYQQQAQQHLWPVQNNNSSSSELASSHEQQQPSGLWPVHQDPPHQQQPQVQAQPSFWAVPPKAPQPQQAQQQHHEDTLTTSQSLWAIPPSNTGASTTSSSAAATSTTTAAYSNNTAATSTPLTSSVSLWAVAPSSSSNTSTPSVAAATTTTTVATPSPSLWAVAPSQQLKMAESSPAIPTTTSSSSATNIPAIVNTTPNHSSTTANSSPTSPIQQFGSENLVLHPSISAKTTQHSSPPIKRGVQFTIDEQETTSDLEDGIESVQLHDPPAGGLSIDTTVSGAGGPCTPSPRVPSDEEENWAERPSVERLYKDIDKYLPGHDLDKEIIVEPTVGGPSTASSANVAQASQQQPTIVTALPAGRRLQGHKKSIRNVAHEAHRNWRNAVNVIRANNLLRRRSTKMWHRTVEQVKPGMKAQLQSDDYIPKSKKLQWIRGELIGKGSFGRVYHALNVEAGEWIAVKQVDLPVTKADYANPQLRETKDALFREISLLEDLDNEYIVQYLGYDVDEDEGHINIFLEYVPGGSIASCLSKTGKFDEPLVRFFTRQILMGLAYLHNRNILHRDIKAGNILLDQNGICKITDFGLSKLSGQDKAYDPHSNNSVMRGTVFWMAPEVVKGTNYNAKIDIWSLGCTVIEMLTGSHPWLDLNMLAALYSLGKYQAPPIPDDVPEEARDFLNLCFTINPEERPTAEQLLKHPFVQPDTTFEFKKYMKKAEIERRASKRLQTKIAPPPVPLAPPPVEN